MLFFPSYYFISFFFLIMIFFLNIIVILIYFFHEMEIIVEDLNINEQIIKINLLFLHVQCKFTNRFLTKVTIFLSI